MRSSEAAAGIVTFNPDIPRLRENLQSVYEQVKTLVLVDNGSDNLHEIESLLAEFPDAHFLRNESNKGISAALNQILDWAQEAGIEWVLVLDQDTVASSNLVRSLEAHRGPDVGIVAPVVVDRSLTPKEPLSERTSEVNYCITSGSLCNVDAWRTLSGYDEAMFIDFVDFDYCLRLRQGGYKIVKANTAVILHEIGQIRQHGPFLAYNHSAFRSYHMARDMLYYSRKHSRSPKVLKVQQRGTLFTYAILFRKLFIVALFEQDRFRRVSALLRGMASGTFRPLNVRPFH